ncbi:MAG TPA: hypothetical protein VF020_07195 [Chthoniobacterales bacterium]
MAEDDKDERLRKIAEEIAGAKNEKGPDIAKINELLDQAEEVEPGVTESKANKRGSSRGGKPKPKKFHNLPLAALRTDFENQSGCSKERGGIRSSL